MGEIPKDLGGRAEKPYKARTPLGARLMRIREEIVASGEPLLSWEGLERELVERRGDVASDFPRSRKH